MIAGGTGATGITGLQGATGETGLPQGQTTFTMLQALVNVSDGTL